MKSCRHMALWLIVIAVAFLSCSKSAVPKPYGYYRLNLPPQVYSNSEAAGTAGRHVQFLINGSAKIAVADAEHEDFFNIIYPDLNATIHCSYLPICRNLPALLKDAQEMVYSHAIKASAIPEQEYVDPAHRVYGVVYTFEGNTATPAQFFLTDSTHHFFRAAVYINTIPNQDSLAPVIDYLLSDVRTMVESFRWNENK